MYTYTVHTQVTKQHCLHITREWTSLVINKNKTKHKFGEITASTQRTKDDNRCFLSFRSTDYGTTYERLNDKIGVKTVLSYLYVCPTNQRKVSGSFFSVSKTIYLLFLMCGLMQFVSHSSYIFFSQKCTLLIPKLKKYYLSYFWTWWH